MRKSQFIFTLMLGCSLATMAKADTSKDNCERVAGEGNCYPILNNPGDPTSGYSNTTYYALSGPEGNQTMTIYGTTGEGSAASVPNFAFYGINSTWQSTLPDGVTSLKTSGSVNIGEGAFTGATGLTSVDLTGVKTIGEAAFWGTTGLKSIDLTGVQTIGKFAFQDATGLTSVDLTGVQTIRSGAFFGATDLTSITISDSLLSAAGNILGYSCDVNNVCAGIYFSAFEGSGLNTIYCPAGKTCENSLEYLSSTPTIVNYTKNGDGTYTTTDDGKMYANADMMTKNITCEGAQCTALRTALDAGGTCSTPEACNTLAAEYATPQPSQPSQPTKPQRADIRIYTIDEANAVAGKVNSVKIRYR